MTKEEDFFKENFPEYVTEKGEFLTPYWDLFRAGVICANFESKVKIEQLEKENAELDCQKNRNKSCYSCANATERCFRNEIGCPCQKYKSYKDEITELKKHNGELAEQRAKAIIKNVIRVTYGEGWNYSLDWKVKAEQFLKEIEK